MEKLEKIKKIFINRIIRLTHLCIANDKSINENYQLVLKELNLQNLNSDLTKNIYKLIESIRCGHVYMRCISMDLSTLLKI